MATFFDTVLANPNYQVGDVIGVFRITKLDRDLEIVEFERVKQDIVEILQSQRSTWSARNRLDFTRIEPDLELALKGDYYLNTASGKGSKTGYEFIKNYLYYVTDNLKWRGIAPKDGWTCTIGPQTFKFLSEQGEWAEKRYFNGLAAWAKNEPVEIGTMRKFNFGGSVVGVGRDNTIVILVSNYERVTRDKLDQEELAWVSGVAQTANNWEMMAQQTILPWKPDTQAFQGLKHQLHGFSGEYKSVAKTAKIFNYVEQINYGFTSTAAYGVGAFIYQPGHGFELGQWLAKPGPEFVLAQPDDPALLETLGVVGKVIDKDAFIIESYGFGCDPYFAEIEDYWAYGPGTVLYLSVDGTVTDTRPEGIARKLGVIWDSGYFLIDQKTLHPRSYVPCFDRWPSDSELRADAVDNENGFRLFFYTGVDRPIGAYLNPNCGKPSALPISQPTKV